MVLDSDGRVPSTAHSLPTGYAVALLQRQMGNPRIRATRYNQPYGADWSNANKLYLISGEEGGLNPNHDFVLVQTLYAYSEDAIVNLEVAFKDPFGNVKIDRLDYPAGGAAEMFFLIAASGGAIYAKAFLETLAAEHAKSINSAIIAALERRPGQGEGIYSVPLRIDVGGIRLYFRHLANDAVLQERAKAALPLLEASLTSDPEHSPAHIRPDGIHIPAIEGRGYYWDLRSSSWKRVPIDWVGEVCPPDAG